MSECEESNDCKDVECFGEDDFGKAIEAANADCKKVMEQINESSNPYQPVTKELMDQYSKCLTYIKGEYSNAKTDPTINCWDKCIQQSNTNIENSSVLLKMSLFVVISLLTLI